MRRSCLRFGFFYPAALLLCILSGPWWHDPPGPMAASSDPEALAASPASSLLIAPSPGRDEADMPPTVFPHGAHVSALNTGGELPCATCHPVDLQTNVVTGKPRLSIAFKRADNGPALSPEEAGSLYHEQCIGCHQALDDAGEAAGPLESSCRSCHDAETVLPDEVPMRFDRSLHYRHIASKLIKPHQSGPDENCSRCHAIFDEAAQAFVYETTKVQGCRACHDDQPRVVDGVEMDSIKYVVHLECVGCHLDLIQSGVATDKAGPIDCAGCHDAARQAEIEKVSDIPRLDRGQPDGTLIFWASPEAYPAGENPSDSIRAMPPVPFDHKSHELRADTCRVCHHERIDSCSMTCHPPEGTEDGAFIGLQQAMHSEISERSCFGCHTQQQAKPQCAGCHGFVIPKQTDSSCGACHLDLAPAQGGDDTGAWTPELAELAAMDLKARRELAKEFLGQRPELPVLADELIPETVDMAALADTYQAASFPHRRIYRALEARLRDNGLAATFHSEEYALCAGCHHNAPAVEKPVSCRNCHTLSDHAGPASPEPFRPRLKGAYHGLCIGCHQRMELEKPRATDCESCHPKKPGEQ